MKLNDVLNLNETILTGSMPQHIINSIYEELNKTGKHIGDQDQCRVVYTQYQDNHIYGLNCGDGIIAFAVFVNVSIAGKQMYQLQVVHSKLRNFFAIMRLLWFVKDQQQKPIVDYGAQSLDGTRLVKAINKTRRFKVAWININTGETQQYEPEDQTKYSQTERTDWRILIENNTTPSFPRFYKSFDWWILFDEKE